ncbi:arginine metabolism regulation protein II [Hypoxylon texense]
MSGWSSYEGQLCCAICGDAILPPTPEPSASLKWQTEAVLLSDPDQEFEQLERHYRGGKKRDAPRLDPHVGHGIRKDRAQVIGGDRLRILPAEKEDTEGGQDREHEVRANNSYIYEVNDQWAVTPYHIATHGACLEVAEDVMHRSPHDIVVRDLRTLWKVLRMRFEVDDSYYMSTVTGAVSRPQRVQLPHGYYMPFRSSRLASGDPSIEQNATDSSGGDHERWEASYPLFVPDLTSAILENLGTLPPVMAAIPESLAFQRQFLALPPEMRDHVCSFLVSRNGMRSTCNGRLPQWVWRDVLLIGQCLPFLPEIDVSVVEDFCSQWEEQHPGKEPNWEFLVRRLSQEDWSIWDAESSSLKVPNGLRNRRRIWQLVEEMYVGDLVSVQRATHHGTDHVAVPRYWDRAGELMYPVIRVNVGSEGTR